jgi:hypothetical protein
VASALVALTVAGCGNYSNDDLAFLAAIPSREHLQIDVPAAPGAPLCALGEATAATNARTSGGNLNRLVAGILDLVDRIRAVPPSVRDGDRRLWGPWPEGTHPGVSVRVSMVRQRGARPADDQFQYVFEEQRPPGDWTPVIAGLFVGAHAATGTGSLMLDFDATWALGTADTSTPRGKLGVGYALAADPRTVEVTLTSRSGTGLEPDVAYRFAGYQDGRAIFDFLFSDDARNRFLVDARFAASGSGRAHLSVTTPGGLSAAIEQCFDGLACITWLLDPLSLSAECGLRRPCSLGAQAACPGGLP